MKRIIISMLALLACVNAITAAPPGGGGGGRGGGIGGGGMGGGGRMGGGMAGGGARMGGGMGGGARGFGGGGMGRMGGGGFAGRSGIGMGARSASFGAGPRMGGSTMGMGGASIGSAQLARPAGMGTMGRSAFSGIQAGAINRPGGITRPAGLGLQPGLSRPGATTLGTQLGTRPGGLRPGQITRPGGQQIIGPGGLGKQAGDISGPGIGRPGGLRPGGQITGPDGLGKQVGDISRPGIGRPGAQNIRPGDVKRLENVSKTAGLNRQTIGNRQALRKQQNQALRNLSKNPKFAGINKQQFKNQFKHKGWKHWHHGPGGWNSGWWGIGGWWPYGNWNLGWNWAWNNGVWWWGGYPWWWWADYDPVYFSNVVYPVYTTYYQDTPGDQVYNYWDITNNTSDQITVQANSGDSEVIDVGQTERVFHTPGNNQFTVQTQTGFREYNTPNPNVVIQERAGDMASQTRSYESPQYEQMDIPAQRMEIEAY